MVELVIADIMSRAADNRAYVLLLQERNGLRKIMVALGMAAPAHAPAVRFTHCGIRHKNAICSYKQYCRWHLLLYNPF